MADPLQEAALQRQQARGGDRGLLEKLMRWMQSQGQDVQPAAQEVNEGMMNALPDPLNATSAIEMDRDRKKRLIDDMLKGSGM
jgi:hypothetical protein